jgi:hypothetical protein
MERIIFWRMRHQMAFIYEADMAAIEHLLPPGIHPVEARPGISLIFIGYNDYLADENTIGGVVQPRFQEMTRCILVQPDLSIKMPIPRFTFFVHRIGSNNGVFIDQEISSLHLPSFHSPTMDVDVNAAGTELRMFDEHGTIQHLRSTHPTPTYRKDAFFGQYYTVADGKLWFGVWSWRGVVCVHQRPGDAGGIFEHPFLTETQRRLPATALGPSYQQFFSRPGEVSEQRFYQPRFVRELKGAR